MGLLLVATIMSTPVQAADNDAPGRVLPSRPLPGSAPMDGPVAPAPDAPTDRAMPAPIPDAKSDGPSSENVQPTTGSAPDDVTKAAPKPAGAAEEQVLPAAPPVERFKPLWQNSPFSRNILPENKAAAATAEFTLLGIGGLGNKWCALVLDKKSQPQRRLLLFDEGSGDRLVKVTESPSLEQVTAEILVGGAPYVVRYDVPALKNQMATPAPGQAHVPAPAIRPASGQTISSHHPQPQAPPPTPVRVLPRRRYYPATNPQR